MIRSNLRRLALVPAMAVVALLGATTAQAHVQVTPSLVATADPVLFTVLVPGETSAGTTRVELKIPPDVYPFNYEDVPGWNRKVIEKPNGLVDRILWTGKAKPDAFARFTFLAGTPEKPTTLEWAAIQTYANGQVSRWIGSPESENPAAVTVVSADAPRQNAGGEGGDEPAAGSDVSEGAGSAGAGSETVASESDDGSDALTLLIALLGLSFGLAALVLVLLGRRQNRA